MAVQLPSQLAIAGDERIEERDSAPVNRWCALARARLQGPIRSCADRYSAIAKIELTASDPLGGGDRRRGGVRAASPELAGGVLRIDETRKKTTREARILAKPSEELVAVRDVCRLRAIEQSRELFVSWLSAIT
jgi:hypothetical protein